MRKFCFEGETEGREEEKKEEERKNRNTDREECGKRQRVVVEKRGREVESRKEEKEKEREGKRRERKVDCCLLLLDKGGVLTTGGIRSFPRNVSWSPLLDPIRGEPIV